MKELSIEEKAQRYDEALKYAIIYYKEGNEDMKMMMKTCFPVLVEESEDERIRKHLINYVKNAGVGLSLFDSVNTRDNILLWLEKQGKKESVTCPICGWEIEKQGEQKEATCVAEIIDRLSEKEQEILFKELNMQKEHNKFIKSIQIGDQVTRNQDGMLVNLSQLKRVAKPADKQGEQKLAWSEEDEAMYEGVIETEQYMLDVVYGRKIFAVGNEDIKKDCTKELAWLKSLKGRVGCKVNCTTTKEWSEEDNRMRKAIIDNIKAICEEGYFVGNIGSDELIVWLKSLRPQKQWRPSKEQMGVIEAVINNRSFQRRHLDSLYEQLKKLRGE